MPPAPPHHIQSHTNLQHAGAFPTPAQLRALGTTARSLNAHNHAVLAQLIHESAGFDRLGPVSPPPRRGSIVAPTRGSWALRAPLGHREAWAVVLRELQRHPDVVLLLAQSAAPHDQVPLQGTGGAHDCINDEY